MIKTAIIRKLPSGKYRLYSRKKDEKGHRRNLGTYDTLAGAKKREKAVQFFKRFHADDHLNFDPAESMSEMAQYLEEAGLIDKAQVLYDTMACFDMEQDARTSKGASITLDKLLDDFYNFYGGMWIEGKRGNAKTNKFAEELLKNMTTYIDESMRQLKQNLDMHIDNLPMLISIRSAVRDYLDMRKESKEDRAIDQIPDAQLNLENEGTLGNMPTIGILSGQRIAFLKLLVKTANEFDDVGLIEDADELDKLLADLVDAYEQNNIDMFVNSNGLQGTGVTDNQNAGMFSGLSDSYFYRSYQSDEGAYEHRNELENKLTI